MFPFVCVVQGVTVAPMALKCHEDNKVYRYKQNTEYGYGHQQVIKTYYKEMIVFLIRFWVVYSITCSLDFILSATQTIFDFRVREGGHSNLF